MSNKFLPGIFFLLLLASIGAAQTDIKIRKTIEMKMPGMPDMSKMDLSKMPAAAQERMKNRFKRESTVFIKGQRMRTDSEMEVPSGFKMEKRRYTTIQQCDKQRMIQFDSKKKKYNIYNFGGDSSGAKDKNSKTSTNKNVMTISVNATDTGEKMQLFGLNARRFKQTITMSSNSNSCLKSPLKMEIDGWYADVEGFSCPLKPDMSGMQESGDCKTEVRYEFSGATVTGVPLKEIKTMTMDGNTMTMFEEVVELTKTPLDALLFDPPTDYTPEDGAAANVSNSKTDTDYNSPSMPETFGTNNQTTLTPPAAGLVQESAPQPKKAGIIRIGIAAPTAEMGKDFTDADTVSAVRNTLAVALKNETVETVQLVSSLPEQEAKQKECDYIFYSKVTRKKGGGGFMKSVVPIVGGVAAGLIPGVGGLIGAVASTTINTATIAGGFKSKDEIGFEYKVTSADGKVLLAPIVTKQKAKKDGDDVLTPQIQQAATMSLTEIGKNK